jgi:hypothetical protein
MTSRPLMPDVLLRDALTSIAKPNNLRALYPRFFLLNNVIYAICFLCRKWALFHDRSPYIKSRISVCAPHLSPPFSGSLSMYSMSKDVSLHHAVALLSVVLCAYLILRKRRNQRLINPRRLPYPPGPKPLPIIGNMLDIAGNNETIVYQRLADKFGAQSFKFLYKYLSSSL